MKSFVITLAGSAERQKKSHDELTKVGVNFEFLYGVDARSSQDPLLERYREQEFEYNLGRPAAIGEIGCYASHYLAWQKCVELNEPIVIFEDDLTIESSFIETLKVCEQQIEKRGYIRLEQADLNKLHYTVDNSGTKEVVKYLKVPQCMTAYAISPSTARAFIETSQHFDHPVDVFVRNTWIHQKPIYGIKPAGLKGFNSPSIIGDRKRKERKKLSVSIMKPLRKLKSMLLNLLTNLKHYIIYK